jgi:UDP-N-acetylmuramyl pentapeptide synthase
MSFEGVHPSTVPQRRSRREQEEDKSITPENPNANASKMQENYQLLSKHNNTNSI